MYTQNNWNITSINIGLLSAGGMGLWHGVEYYEKEKIVGEEYYQQWSNVSISSFALSRYIDRQNKRKERNFSKKGWRNNFQADICEISLTIYI